MPEEAPPLTKTQLSPAPEGSKASRVRKGTTTYRTDKKRRAHTGLVFMAIFYAVAFFLAYAADLLVADEARKAAVFSSPQLEVAILSILSAVGIFVVARWRLLSDQAISTMALIWWAPGTLGIIIGEGWLRTVAAGSGPVPTVVGISWAAVFICIFPLVIEAKVVPTVAAGLVAAAIGPAFIAIYAQVTGTAVSNEVLLPLTMNLLICGVLTFLPAMVLRNYRKDADKARLLGAYRLVDRVGEGGMGEVWRAEHHLLARPAAIKLIRPEALVETEGSAKTEGSTMHRFEREAQATSSLMSPHTIDVYDFGISERGTFFFVMELLHGMDAQTLVQRFGPLSVPRAIYLIEQVCHSLAEAHHRELVHRDIKPANIFVCRRGLDDDFVKVLDFGLVKGTPLAEKAGTQLTARGLAAGTPAYMPPEAALGHTDVSPESDIYSLGCVAFFLVTGREVFLAESALAVAVKHVQEQPDPPSAHSELPIPAEYDELVLACLAKKRDERIPSVEELLELLRAVPVDPWTGDRACSWWEKNAPEFRADTGPA